MTQHAKDFISPFQQGGTSCLACRLCQHPLTLALLQRPLGEACQGPCPAERHADAKLNAGYRSTRQSPFPTKMIPDSLAQ